MVARLLVLAVLASYLASCRGETPATAVATTMPPGASGTARAIPATATAPRAGTTGSPTLASCPVTPYAPGPPPGSANDRALGSLSTFAQWYGGDGLWAFPWVGDDTPGTLTLDADGFHKVLWWREPGVEGIIAVTARRLDSPTAPVEPYTEGLPTRRGQQPGGLRFPTTGCWEITGAAGGKRLTFVALVVPQPATPTRPPAPTASARAVAPTATVALPPGCDEAAILGVVHGFVDAFNRGDQAALARFFPDRGTDGDHPWNGDFDQLRWFTLVRANPGKGVDVLDLSTPQTLLAYFAERHAQHERMQIVKLVINRGASGPGSAAINFRVARAADDLPKMVFSGKGGVGCARGTIFL